VVLVGLIIALDYIFSGDAQEPVNPKPSILSEL